MKLKNIFLLLILMFACACAKSPASRSATNNVEIPVDFLFEHEGCKVYRFLDAGYYRYFTNCTQTMSTQSCGKNCTREESIGSKR